MAHDHHHHAPPVQGGHNGAFALGVALNVAFVVVEVVYGLLADSLALIADAGHNLSDVLSLLLAWGAAWLATRPPTLRRSYGYRRVTILASVFSAMLLLAALGGIAWEAIHRFQDPQPVQGRVVILVAFIGVIINTATALLFVRGQKHDLNIRGAFLHMAADAAVSLGVVVAGIAILYTGWLWLDPAISLAHICHPLSYPLVHQWFIFKKSPSGTTRRSFCENGAQWMNLRTPPGCRSMPSAWKIARCCPSGRVALRTCRVCPPGC